MSTEKKAAKDSEQATNNLPSLDNIKGKTPDEASAGAKKDTKDPMMDYMNNLQGMVDGINETVLSLTGINSVTASVGNLADKAWDSLSSAFSTKDTSSDKTHPTSELSSEAENSTQLSPMPDSTDMASLLDDVEFGSSNTARTERLDTATDESTERLSMA